MLVVAARNRLQLDGLERWLLPTLFLALLAQASHLIGAWAGQAPLSALFGGGFTPEALTVYLTSLMLVVFAAVSARYLQRAGATALLVLGIVWVAAVIAISLGPQSSGVLGKAGWLRRVFSNPPDPVGLVAVGGWIAIGILALLIAFYSFYRAHLPEIANRALFWVIIVPLVLMGAVLGVNGTDLLKEIGWATQFAGLIGVLYGTTTHRVFDIRRVLRLAIASVLGTGITALVVPAALMLARTIDPAVSNGFVLLAGPAVLTAVIFAAGRSPMVSIV